MLHKEGQKKHGEHSSILAGTTMTDTESRCRTMDGMRATSCYLTELPWKLIRTSQQELRQFETQNIGF